MMKMQKIMDSLRENAPASIAEIPVVGWSDYEKSVRSDAGNESPIDLPKSNVLEYRLENGCKVIVRPSGTEPKIKIYLSAKGKDEAESDALITALEEAGKALISERQA